MLITTKNKTDASNLQMALVHDYPASNYISAEFAEVWVKAYNDAIMKQIVIAGLITAIPIMGIEVLFGALRKSRKKDA